MKYISFFNARSGKWFARSLSSGKTITTARLMDEVATTWAECLVTSRTS